MQLFICFGSDPVYEQIKDYFFIPTTLIRYILQSTMPKYSTQEALFGPHSQQQDWLIIMSVKAFRVDKIPLKRQTLHSTLRLTNRKTWQNRQGENKTRRKYSTVWSKLFQVCFSANKMNISNKKLDAWLFVQLIVKGLYTSCKNYPCNLYASCTAQLDWNLPCQVTQGCRNMSDKTHQRNISTNPTFDWWQFVKWLLL